ncbi:MAG: DMT family transporter [Oscillospiraceae bacterium]|nr:DMT family transporter [Oscillospiraceae bacterium]
MEKKQWLGHIAVLTAVCIWGFAFVPIVVALRSFTPAELLFYRFSLATAALYLIYPKSMGKTTWRQELLFAAAGLTGVTMFFLLQDFALLVTAASNVGVIAAVSPMFTALLSWGFLNTGRPAKAFFLGAGMALFGIALISFSGSRLELSPIGDFLAVLMALCWAVYCIFTKQIAAFGYHVIQTTRRIFLYGLFFLLLILFFLDFRLGIERFLEPVNLASMLFLGFGPSALCFVLWGYGVKQLGPTKTSVYLYLIPLVSVVASVLFLGERIIWMNALGILLALLGLVVSNRKARQAETVLVE